MVICYHSPGKPMHISSLRVPSWCSVNRHSWNWLSGPRCQPCEGRSHLGSVSSSPSWLTLASWGPRHCRAETSYPLHALTKFLTDRVHELFVWLFMPWSFRVVCYAVIAKWKRYCYWSEGEQMLNRPKHAAATMTLFLPPFWLERQGWLHGKVTCAATHSPAPRGTLHLV